MSDVDDQRRYYERMISAIKAENASLKGAAQGLGELCDRYKAENAKLRELVADMWRAGAFEPGACYVDEADSLEERTRELGIEVDE